VGTVTLLCLVDGERPHLGVAVRHERQQASLIVLYAILA
jgi:hypothetical protein